VEVYPNRDECKNSRPSDREVQCRMEKPVRVYKLRPCVIGACHRRQLPVRPFIVFVEKKGGRGKTVPGGGWRRGPVNISRIKARNGQIIERISSVLAGARARSKINRWGITGLSTVAISNIAQDKPSISHLHS